MKNLMVLLVLILGISSCKDVEKNPSSCGNDYVKEGSRCINVDIKIKSEIRSNDENIYNIGVLKHYLQGKDDSDDNYYPDFQIQEDLIDKRLSGEKPFSTFLRDHLQLVGLKESTEQSIIRLERLYNKNYNSKAYQELQKLRNLKEKLEGVTKVDGDMEYIMELEEENRDNAIKLLNDMYEASGSKNVRLQYMYTSYEEGICLKLLSDNYESRDLLRKDIVKSLANKVECENNLDTCVLDLKEKAREFTPDFYYRIISSIDQKDYP